MPIFTERIRRNILLVSITAAVMTIPLHNNLNSIALIFFVCASLFESSFKEARQRLSEQKIWMVPAIYFLCLVISYFWDVSGGFSIRQIEQYATLFFIP